MKNVNRIAISVTPREPYMAWAQRVAGDSAAAPASTDAFTSVYLIDAPDVFDPELLIRRHFAAIFEEQLNSWHRDETGWPKCRTESVFREWFEAKVVDMVWDLGRGEIEVEE